MGTHFVTGAIALQPSQTLLDRILTMLSEQGEPLRWAITAVDQAKQEAYIEAVITVDSERTTVSS
jgi:hypothetical protein